MRRAYLLFVSPPCVVTIASASHLAWQAQEGAFLQHAWVLVPIALGVQLIVLAVVFVIAFGFATLIHRRPVVAASQLWLIFSGILLGCLLLLLDPAHYIKLSLLTAPLLGFALFRAGTDPRGGCTD